MTRREERVGESRAVAHRHAVLAHELPNLARRVRQAANADKLLPCCEPVVQGIVVDSPER
jgi:hypothetical protein